MLQMQAQLMCTGRKWCAFVSYDDRVKGLEISTLTIESNEELQEEITIEVKKFNDELNILYEKLISMAKTAPHVEPYKITGRS